MNDYFSIFENFHPLDESNVDQFADLLDFNYCRETLDSNNENDLSCESYQFEELFPSENPYLDREYSAMDDQKQHNSYLSVDVQDIEVPLPSEKAKIENEAMDSCNPDLCKLLTSDSFQKSAQSEELKEDDGRNWLINSDEFQDHISLSHFSIFLKSRLVPESQSVPRNMYCTLRYTLIVRSNVISPCNSASALLARLSLENSDGSVPNQPFKEDIPDLAFCYSNGIYESRVSFSFNVLHSWQRSPREFSLVVKVFDASERESPLASYKSPSFRIYARKPNQPPKRSKTCVSGLKKSNKMTKSNKQKKDSQKNLESFAKDLESLIHMYQTFDMPLQRKGQDMIRNMLIVNLRQVGNETLF